MLILLRAHFVIVRNPRGLRPSSCALAFKFRRMGKAEGDDLRHIGVGFGIRA